MAMQPIVFKVALFRGDFNQARSQYSLLWMLESLVRINQSHIRQFRGLAKEGKVPGPYPSIYRSGVHYEPEAGTEEWLDIPTILSVTGGTFPGPWGDCEDLACWRAAELREDLHRPVKAKPFAKWKKKGDGAYAYHALVLLPDGRLEDPSLCLGMQNEGEFARLRMAERYKEGSLTPVVRYAETPDVVVVDPAKKSGYAKDIDKAKRLTGLDKDVPPAGAPITGLVTGKMPMTSLIPGAKGPGITGVRGQFRADRRTADRRSCGQQSCGQQSCGADMGAWGFDRGDVDERDMRALLDFQRKTGERPW